jgi:hypothetical protein
MHSGVMLPTGMFTELLVVYVPDVNHAACSRQYTNAAAPAARLYLDSLL